MIRLTRSGAVCQASAAAIDEARARYREQHALLLDGLVEPGLLQGIQRALASSALVHRLNAGIGTELRLPPGPLSGAIEFLVNDPVLFETIEAITECPPIGCYRGRVYQMAPGAGHETGWHSDVSGGRMVTMSINLSGDTFEGGALQIREVETGRLLFEKRNTGPGDAVIFQIDPRFEHRVLPLEGTVARSAYAGWFLKEPNYASMLREELARSA